MTENKPANILEDLPPLREGFVRVVHQTRSSSTDSIVENGLIYNREFANSNKGSKYLDLQSMAIGHTEDSFWNSLEKSGIRHNGADKKVIFDMPIEECGAHQNTAITQYLSGKISKEYIVGVIDNYGTDDKKLSHEEAVAIREKVSKNPLPNEFQTPNWKESVKNAWESFDKAQENITGFGFGATQNNNEIEDIKTNEVESVQNYSPENFDWDDFGDDWGEKPAADNSDKNIKNKIENARRRLKGNDEIIGPIKSKPYSKEVTPQTLRLASEKKNHSK